MTDTRHIEYARLHGMLHRSRDHADAFYRGFRITPDPLDPPHWLFAHTEFRGKGDERIGTAPTLAAARRTIDDLYTAGMVSLRDDPHPAVHVMDLARDRFEEIARWIDEGRPYTAKHKALECAKQIEGLLGPKDPQ